MKPFLSRESAFARNLMRYAFSTVAVGVLLAIRSALDPYLAGHIPFTFFMFSAMVAGWYGGLGPGMLAVILGLLVGDYFFMEPYKEIGLHKPVDVLQYLVYILPSCVAVLLMEALHRTSGKLEHAVGDLNQELTRREAAEAELREAEEALNQHAAHLEERVAERTAKLEETVHSLETFSYTVAHNLRAPLRTLEGMSHMLIEEYGAQLDPAATDYMKRIRRAAIRMDSLICDLVHYDRADRDRFHVAPVSLIDPLRDALQSLRPEVEKKKAKVEVKEPLPTVLAHPLLMEHVFSHLISNAVKFVTEDVTPEVRIFSEDTGSRCRIYIQDNGIGIASEHRERVFGLFERLDGSDRYPGNGMGLAIVRKGVERMGGSVGLCSEQGKGSTFWVELAKATPSGR